MALRVAPVSRMDCAPFILGIHYARRFPSITYAFGLFDGDALIGVVTYGTPPSAPLRSGVAGRDMAPYVIELNRLCLRDNRKNDASFLVSRSLKLIGDKIVISFADLGQGHIGTVYQACNFSYHGLSAKRTDWKIKGYEHLHGQTVADKYRGVKNRAEAIRKDCGDDFYLAPRTRKHRYLYFAGSRKFVKMARMRVAYAKLPYPKAILEANNETR